MFYILSMNDIEKLQQRFAKAKLAEEFREIGREADALILRVNRSTVRPSLDKIETLGHIRKLRDMAQEFARGSAKSALSVMQVKKVAGQLSPLRRRAIRSLLQDGFEQSEVCSLLRVAPTLVYDETKR